jgi:hypothetical protein
MLSSISKLPDKLKSWIRQRIAYLLLFQATKDKRVQHKLATTVLDFVFQVPYFRDQFIPVLVQEILGSPLHDNGYSALLEYDASKGDLQEFAPIIARLMPRYLQDPYYGKYFQSWEDHGFHLTPNHYYSPLPDTRSFTKDLWTRESEMVGVDINTATQLDFLTRTFPIYRDEYNQFSYEPTDREYEFYFNNGMFSGTDALVLYCMVRHFRPKLILEVGSGFSTRVSAQAAVRNGDTRLVSIEPFPPDILRKGFPGLTSLVEKPVQEVGLAPFLELNRDDILFIDTSHVTKIGGEVNFLFLEVLPRLKPGVVVQVHDIFLPLEYPEAWIMGARLFSNEQYLVQAFLSFNREFEILFANSYIALKYPQLMSEIFPKSNWWGGGSLWIQRK